MADNKEVGRILQEIEEVSEGFKKEREEGVTGEVVLKEVRVELKAGGEEGCFLVGRTGG